ncbi:extracellular solute-binding protein [Endozoicomonas arenosclerae]|uniref:extracellular solute-binding protein n=1 Tax=Endozoicomonas arenosclerae TaxID=1633495 RepID=UPI00078281FC|nr:extracellular solute-binding protein [Endozoicomonas arenosclerae]
MKRLNAGLTALILSGLLISSQSMAHHDLVIYSTRNVELITPLTEKYQQARGVKIKLVEVEEERLIESFKSPEQSREADLFFAKSIHSLFEAQKGGLLKTVRSEVLNHNIPEHLRSKENIWFGISLRARAIVYKSDQVMHSELFSYAALAGPNWADRLCMISGMNPYNQLLIASLILRYGAADTEQILSGWVNNLALPPMKSDSEAIKAIEQGICDAAIVNHYYFSRAKMAKPDLQLGIFWPNQRGQGVHVGISAIAMAKSTHAEKEAIAFMEWLSGKEAQLLMTELNNEFPVNPRVPPSDNLSMLGGFKQDSLPLDDLVGLMDKAQAIIRKTGFLADQ